MAEERINLDDREFRLSRYLDAELDAEEVRRLEREIDADPALRRLLEEYRRTEGWVKASAGPVPEPDWDRFRGQVFWRCGAASARPRPARYRAIAPLVAAAAIIALAFTLYTRSTPRPDSPDSRLAHNAPAPSTDTTTGIAVVSVEFDRTMQETQPDEPEEDEMDEAGSFVIAAAGARPLDDPSADEESPTF